MEISKSLLLPALFAISISVFAQSSKKLIHDGNEMYEQKKFAEAEKNYRKALTDKDNAFIGNYNLGNALYQEGKLDEARDQYQTAAANKSASSEQLSKAYHNLGNAYLKNKKLEESIQSYKQSLKLNPKDNDTRYNLAYAQSMLQQQQQQQKSKGDKNKDQKDKDKDQQKQDKDKQDQQKQDQQKQSDDQQQADQKNAQPKDKISKEDAEKILQALNNDEKKTQKKMTIKQPVKVTIDKQW